MGSLVNPKPWVPYLNNKDCSQGFCSLYCPQWCYVIFPPPPPIEFPTENPSPNFSPLIIAIIGILASAFLLVSYYAIISKYCVNNNSSRRRGNHDSNEELEGNDDPSRLEPWHVANNGLDEALIKSITVCKYKRGHGLIEGTDCSVCLSEFEEEESVRLLPKCSHAFHVVCIDTWLKSHSNCPLCRANIISLTPPPPLLPPSAPGLPPNIEYVPESSENQFIVEDIETGNVREGETLQNGKDSKEEDNDTVSEIRNGKFNKIRRSVSMDFNYGERLSIVDVLMLNQDSDLGVEKSGLRNDDVGSSKQLQHLHGPEAMKRSFSSGGFSSGKRSKDGI